MEAIVYLITHKDTGRKYVGKRHFSKEKFMDTSYYGSGKYIRRAVKKYGCEAFSRRILWEGHKNHVSDFEKIFITFFDCLAPKGFNIGRGGEGDSGGPNKGKKWGEETRRKMSENRKGKGTGDRNAMRRPEVAAKLRGLTRSEESKQKMRLAALGRVVSVETRKKISKAQRKMYESGHVNNRKGFKKVNNIWIKES